MQCAIQPGLLHFFLDLNPHTMLENQVEHFLTLLFLVYQLSAER
jgi:hypothetical protein